MAFFLIFSSWFFERLSESPMARFWPAFDSWLGGPATAAWASARPGAVHALHLAVPMSMATWLKKCVCMIFASAVAMS